MTMNTDEIKRVIEDSEGMTTATDMLPKRGDYLVTDGHEFDVQLFDGELFIPGFVWEDNVTQWMPLPAVPEVVKP
ncbi:hypothetical protein [Klebsiella oxytoca]|uniref:hypothetical protein n=1 Tax=Klebsiella oxytoca TaxID=571 RepID=UPI001CCC9CE3|nr:hypothetical protein [Klebsiella oxytoca]MCW9548044.1 hypothetical protein [Klebsiella oxytoca]